MTCAYGPIQKNATLRVVQVGYDYYGVHYQGKYICVPMNLTSDEPIYEPEEKD
jgi:hypothetical protein